MVDACHIIPFSLSHDDTIGNGICLSPNIHRAFDRGLITIDENYLIRLSPPLVESDSPFKLYQFNGKNISLPTLDKYYPNQQNLDWHRNTVFLD
ncbi:MAG: HNH endonuclease [Saprospiraceae bacterium]